MQPFGNPIKQLIQHQVLRVLQRHLPAIPLNLLPIVLHTKRIILTIAPDPDLRRGPGLLLLGLEFVYVYLALVGLLEHLGDQLNLLLDLLLVFWGEFLFGLFLLVLHYEWLQIDFLDGGLEAWGLAADAEVVWGVDCAVVIAGGLV